MFETIKVCILGAVIIVIIACTWTVQNWRWEAKQTSALQEQATAIKNEANKEAKAATGFEKKEAARNDKYDKLVQNLPKGNHSCLDANGLRELNSALSRKATNPR
jgi:sensor domain CHASE-containing protein